MRITMSAIVLMLLSAAMSSAQICPPVDVSYVVRSENGQVRGQRQTTQAFPQSDGRRYLRQSARSDDPAALASRRAVNVGEK